MPMLREINKLLKMVKSIDEKTPELKANDERIRQLEARIADLEGLVLAPR